MKGFSAVSFARECAIASFIPLSSAYPELGAAGVKPERWHFFMTVAAASAAGDLCPVITNDKRLFAFYGALLKGLDEYSPQARAAFQDLKHYIKRNEGEGVEPYQLVGLWVIYNLELFPNPEPDVRHEVDSDVVRIASGIGRFLGEAVHESLW